MRNNYFNDSNSLTITANEIEVKPLADMRRGYRDIRPGVTIKIPNYDLKAVLINMLEDYSPGTLISLIQEIENN